MFALKKSIAKCTPTPSLFGIGRSLGLVAPVVKSKISLLLVRSFIETELSDSPPTSVFVKNFIPSVFICSVL